MKAPLVLFAVLALGCASGGGPAPGAVAQDASPSQDGVATSPDTGAPAPDTAAPTPDVGGDTAVADDIPWVAEDPCSPWFVPPEDGCRETHETCLEDCPEGWSCKSILSGGGDLVFVCVPNEE